MTESFKDRWCGESCTLNGLPAKVIGRLREFALIAPLNSEMSGVEYAWATVNRIMLHNRCFGSIK